MAKLKVLLKTEIVLVVDKLLLSWADLAPDMVELQVHVHRVFVVQGLVAVLAKGVEEGNVSILVLVTGFEMLV